MPDPSGSGSAYDFVATFLEQRGEDAGSMYFSALKANGLIVPGTNAKAQEPVTSGGRLAMLGAVDHTAYASIVRGEKLAIVYPKSGTVLSPRPLVILKSTKNAAAAKAFVDFVLLALARHRAARRPAEGADELAAPGPRLLPLAASQSALALPLWSRNRTFPHASCCMACCSCPS